MPTDGQQASASGGADRITQLKPPAQLDFAVTGYCSFKNHTQKDNSHQELIKVVEAGWPQTKGELPHLVLPFFDVRDELSVCNGIVITGKKWWSLSRCVKTCCIVSITLIVGL